MKRFLLSVIVVSVLLLVACVAPTIPTTPAAGNRIAFESVRDGNGEIYVMDADGSNQTRLTNNPADDWLPAWSPDGSRIAF